MVMSSQKYLTILFLILSVGIAIVVSRTAPIQKRSLMGLSQVDGSDMKLRPNKRTFCNAFTGCAGKRSDPVVVSTKQDYDYDQQGGEGNEDSVDDVVRDILAEARLYEALHSRGGAGRPSEQNRQVGFFPRQKRSAGGAKDADDESTKTGKSHH